MTARSDMEACRAMIRTGSRSFHTASKLLPQRLRDPALALYAFCRLADDAVDEHDDKAGAVVRLNARLERAYAGCPRNSPADRAFAEMVAAFDMPRALPDALLEGLAWDAQARRYATLSDLRAYSARVASAVGVMMCVLMGVRDRDALARAADLGVAMQLTNIARDVGEDARAGRLYLPLDWWAEAGLDPESFLAAPRATPPLRRMVARLLAEADQLYLQADAGIAALPLSARPGIFAARHAYAGIGGRIRARDHDSITGRAITTGGQKLGWLALALLRTGVVSLMPHSATLHRKPLEETAFLVEAAAKAEGRPGRVAARSNALIAILTQLEQTDRERQATRMF
ncbi:MAG: phytoene/squalene synthase family protein [Silicimonas sp.]|nr:phytoene/squalene synthase family protein [Silicimonas sp.]